MEKKRCPNGTRKNKITGKCEAKTTPKTTPPKTTPPKTTTPKAKRCPNGSRKNKKTGECEPIPRPKEKTPTPPLRQKTPTPSPLRQKTPTPSPLRQKIPSPLRQKTPTPIKEKKEKSRKKIGQFFLKNRYKIKASYLKAVCSNSNYCISFGKESDNINKFFNFTSFDYIDKNDKNSVKMIGRGMNSFITQIKYSREGYLANAILKSNKDEYSDNLVYEYLVGKQINKWLKQYPCFLETYGVFYSDSDYSSIHECLTNKNFENIVQMNDTDANFIEQSCIYDDLGVLIQYLDNPITMRQYLEDDRNYDDLLYILYQVYMPLKYLKHNFTHYDLHLNNVLLYEPEVNTYIEYHYHLSDGTTTIFKSKYLAKIIDYGRSFFQDDKNPENNSLKIYKEAQKFCDYMDISTTQNNISIDLRLLESINLFTERKNIDIPDELLKKLCKNVNKSEHENKTPGIDGKINNVDDAFIEINKLIHKSDYKTKNEEIYSGIKKKGILHIYANGKPAEFVEN